MSQNSKAASLYDYKKYKEEEKERKEAERQAKMVNSVRKIESLQIVDEGNFVEDNMIRMKEEDEEGDIKRLYAKHQKFDNAKEIFNGQRTPEVKLRLLDKKERNIIQPGQMVEYDLGLYIGCKDGSIRVLRFSDIHEEVQSKRFYPHQDFGIQRMMIYQSTLFTHAFVTKELKVWSIKGWIQQNDNNPPKCILTLKNVFSFDIRPYGTSDHIVFICFQNTIQCRNLSNMSEVKEYPNLVFSNEVPESSWVTQSPVGGLIFVRENEIIRRTKDFEKVILRKESHYTVQGFFVDKEILTITFGDTGKKDIVVWFIDLQRMEDVIEGAEKKRILRQQKKREQEEELKRLQTLGPEALLRHKPQTIEDDVSEDGDLASRYMEILHLSSYLGECIGVYESVNHEARFIASGTQGFAIFDNQQVLHKVITDFVNQMCIFSYDDNYVMMVSEVGKIAYLDWTANDEDRFIVIPQEQVSHVVASRCNSMLALVTNRQTSLCIYEYSTMEVIYQLDELDPVFLVSFTANSKLLLFVTSSERPPLDSLRDHIDADHTFYYQVMAVPLDRATSYRVWSLPFIIRLDEVYPQQIDACIDTAEIYIVSKNAHGYSQLNIFELSQLKAKSFLKNIHCVAVSHDQKLVAFVDQSGIIFMKHTRNFETLNEIKTQNQDIWTIQFFEYSKKLLVSSTQEIWAIDFMTHDIIFTLSHPLAKITYRTVSLINDNFINFVDAEESFAIYDIINATTMISAQSEQLQPIKVEINPFFGDVLHYACCSVGNHLLMTMRETQKLISQRNPFMHESYTGDDALTSFLQKIEGLFIPVLMGGPVMSTGSFAGIYNAAYKAATEDDAALAAQEQAIQTLQTIIYPFRINALHFFAIDGNAEALAFCFKEQVVWIKDVFGKDPLDYALDSGDRQILETVIEGLYTMEAAAREAVMRTIPLNILIQQPSVFLPNLLRDAGASSPPESRICNGAKLPKIFPIKRQTFAEGSDVYYDLKIREILHPRENLHKDIRRGQVSTLVMNNPIPENATESSLNLLKAIAECKSDEVVRSKPVTIFLNRKWNALAYNFYFFTLIVFLLLVGSTNFISNYAPDYQEATDSTISLKSKGSSSSDSSDSSQTSTSSNSTSTSTSTSTGEHQNQEFYKFMFTLTLSTSFLSNTYFTLYELLQMYIQRLDYFSDIKNLSDILRAVMNFLYIFQFLAPSVLTLPEDFYAMISVLMWYKFLNYLTIFKPTRYLIKMIFEIINDIRAFLIILFAAMFAYAQISYALQGNIDSSDASYNSFSTELRLSYAFAYGELPDYETVPWLDFFVFFIFSFFIPLVLLNMVIAIMGDSYARVQANAIAADARSLAELELEMEELVNLYYSKFKPEKLKDVYYFCFCTKLNDGEDDDDEWEGTVGQVKNIIEASSDDLLTKIKQQFKETNNFVKAGNAIGDTNTRSLTEARNMIDRTQQSVENQSKDIQTKIEESTTQMVEFTEAKIVDTHEKLAEYNAALKKIINETTDQISQLIEKNSSEQIRTQNKNYDQTIQLQKQSILYLVSKMLKIYFYDSQCFNSLSQAAESQKNALEQNAALIQKLNRESIEKHEEGLKSLERNVNDTVSMETMKVILGVGDSTQKVLQSVDHTSANEIGEVQSLVQKQTAHHQQMVQLSMEYQNRTNKLLDEAQTQQKKILALVDNNNMAQVIKEQTDLMKEDLNLRVANLSKDQKEKIEKIAEKQVSQANFMKEELANVREELSKIMIMGKDTLHNQHKQQVQLKQQKRMLNEHKEDILDVNVDIQNKQVEVLEKQQEILEKENGSLPSMPILRTESWKDIIRQKTGAQVEKKPSDRKIKYSTTESPTKSRRLKKAMKSQVSQLLLDSAEEDDNEKVDADQDGR